MLDIKVIPLDFAVNKKVVEFLVKRVHRLNKAIFAVFKPDSYLLQPDSIMYSLNEYWFSNEKLKNTGYELKYPDAVEGMKETVEWYRSEGYV